MNFVIALIGLFGMLGFVVGIVMVCKKSWRKNGLRTLLGGIALFVVYALLIPSDDTRAREVGFESAADQKKASANGFSDPEKWASKRAEVLSAEQRQKEIEAKAEAEKQQKELAKQNAKAQFYAIPDTEQAFIDAVKKAKTTYANADNDFKKGGARSDRAKAVCQAVPSPFVQNWVGTISELTTNGDGLGVLSVELGNNITVKTWNNAVSDMFDNTLIKQDTAMFKVLSELKKGEKIKFSGSFKRDDQETDCYRESSLTMSGSMTSPEYVFQFNSVSVFPDAP